MSREEEWAEISKKILDVDHLPYGSPDIKFLNEIIAIKAGYKCYADYQRDVKAVEKMKKLRKAGEL